MQSLKYALWHARSIRRPMPTNVHRLATSPVNPKPFTSYSIHFRLAANTAILNTNSAAFRYPSLLSFFKIQRSCRLPSIFLSFSLQNIIIFTRPFFCPPPLLSLPNLVALAHKNPSANFISKCLNSLIDLTRSPLQTAGCMFHFPLYPRIS